MAALQSLKDIPFAVQSGKLGVRRKVFEQLEELAEKNAEPHTLKSICKLLQMTLARYGDRKSTNIVDNYVKILITRQPASVPFLIKLIADVAESYKNVQPTKAIAHICYAAFGWSCHVASETLDSSENHIEDPKILLQSQATLLFVITGAQSKFLNQKTFKTAVNLWKKSSRIVDEYVAYLKTAPEHLSSLVLIGFFVKYLADRKMKDILSETKEHAIHLLCKVVIGSKTKPPAHILESCSGYLRQITHDEFKSTILPSIQKALLRNPEVIFETVSNIVSNVSLDLSQYALEIGRSIGAHLHSKEDQCREDAIVCSKCLAKQCSSSQSIKDLLEHFFGILNGSEGKLTVVTQKLGVLSGIGNLSYNIVTGSTSVQAVCEFAADKFIAVLKHEVHEGTITHALSMLSLWCAKFSQNVPNNLLSLFKDGLTQKSSTFAIRNSYILCMNAAFHDNTLHQAVEFIPLLEKTYNKALSQPSQTAAVVEGLSVFCLFLKLYTLDSEAENKLKGILNVDVNKLPFLSEKFLSCCSDEALLSVMYIIERLILDHGQKLGNDTSSLKRAMLFILTRPQFRVRMLASTHLKKMLSALGGTSLACFLLKEFPAFIDTVKIKKYCYKDDENESELDNHINVQVLVSCLLALCSGTNLDAYDVQEICLEALLPSHMDIIYESHPYLWEKIITKLKEKPTDFVKTHREKIIVQILDETSGSDSLAKAKLNALKTLVHLQPVDVTSAVVYHTCTILKDSAFVQVTKEEYNIFITPEGELYDTSVIENLKENINSTKNIKRESKLYSYKDQLEELELKKEIEAKKRAKGLIKEPELTKKQIEAKKSQLEKESAIRAKLKKLNDHFQCALDKVNAIIESKPSTLGVYMKDLTYVLIPLFSSPLCAYRATHLFVSLSSVVPTGVLSLWSKPIAYSTLRLFEAACDLDPSWTEIDVNEITLKIIKFLYLNTCQTSVSGYDEHLLSQTAKNHLSAPGFSYCFPLMQHLLLNQTSNVLLLEQILCIVSEHLDIRAIDEMTGKIYQESVPILQILDSLLKVICKTTGQLQNLAVETLVKACEAASGEENCSFATMEEIDILLSALLLSEEQARQAALRGLKALQIVLPHPDVNLKHGMLVLERIFVACFDPVEKNAASANELWKILECQKNPAFHDLILNDIIHKESVVRQAAADALSDMLNNYSDLVPVTIEKLLDMYHEKLYLPPPVLDSLHRVISESPPDMWEERCGIALGLGKLSLFLNLDQVKDLASFFVPEGLGDRHAIVRKHMLDAAVAIIDAHGKDGLPDLLPVFEEFMDKAPNNSSYDAVRQSVVILMGTLARHLEKDDPRVKPIIIKLIEALSTPSQQVQEAVANCLPPLVPAIKDEAPNLVQTLLDLLLESDSYGERKGAAYGLAGLVKGLGILSLKQLNIMNSLTTAIQNKKNYKHREGSLFAFEMLCNMLGRLFEPYVVNFLPHLLNCFGDGNQYVREATDDTAKAVMSRLSAHGVKLVLPSLINALEEDSWRTKTGSIELLGAMAFCAPKQLSSCLPSIVPRLIEVLSDSHMNVQKAGAQALKQIGSVIRNPEIQAIVPTLLDALQDPSKKTSPCLAALLDTRFVHFIDAPSLALIMPVVQRAFQDRSTETRKMSAQIIGNMYSLTDQKDLAPYLPNIIPGLKQSLLDPVPEVRSVSARALGAMVKGMGESSFEDLLPWLMQTLASESSSVDRSGAAQGLSEVIGGLGVEKLKTFMPEIIVTAERMDIAPHVKDGYIMMFIYLPMVFKKEFTPYIGQIINPILKALADENEYVRDTALRAGQRIVNMYADTAITLLLPELERGLFDDNWRIRYSSVQLLGDLLYKISGVTGKMTTETADEDDNFGTEQSHKAILGSLGHDRRNRVLAGLYMGRSDVALMVRQAALHVWKVVVTNTPRTLREILPTLFSLLLGCLASNSYDKRQVAARTLGDLVRKLGERVLPEIIPILENGLDSERADQRQGVCIGLSEIMASTSREMVLTFVDSLVPTVRRALSDPLPEVRLAAATTFDSLHSTVGVRALDEILPPLLRQLSDPSQSEYTLDGLRQVMAIKSKVVLPYLVPQLTAPPVNVKALSFLSAVAGEALTKHLPKILPALLSALSSAIGTSNETQTLEYCQTVVLAATDDLGVRTIVDHLLESTRSDDPLRRHAAVALLCSYCCQRKVDISQHVPQLLRGLIRLFTERDQKVLQLSWEALNAVTKNLSSSEQLRLISDVRQAVRFAASDVKVENGEKLLPGFCLPKGISPILPIFREAILNGVAEDKEQAAQGLGEVIKLTSADALKPSVSNITGPLIRILGDRYNWPTKVAFLETLALLLAKVGTMLKSFLPQLQTTFLKSLSDGHRAVRLRSASALSSLMLVHNRPDTLYIELHNAVKNAEDHSLKETMLHALRCTIKPAGDKMSDPVRRSVINTVTSMLGHSDDSCRVVAAACLGTLCEFLPEDEFEDVVHEHLLDDDTSLDWTLRHGRSVALMVALKEAPNRLLKEQWNERITKVILAYLTADRLAIVLSGVRAAGYYMAHKLQTEEQIQQLLLTTFSKSMNHSTNEVKQAVALTVNFLARNYSLPMYVTKSFIPHLVNGTKEKNTIVKSNSEFALVTLLDLRTSEERSQECLNALDVGAREALHDVIAKVLKKVASQPEPKEEELDDTLLT
ncbi:eIF-2-alpha kinase activator GCN1-like [Uloborus diversus]|uniref:eIF-2-alpha kinase activator GCN1-like n=1 Tax=Uloborus diversus TaxID=327109 RepID=UPI00240A870A|nr:eIF-2-alpha kinase activator GCN1-like [Uloborus diversus]